MSHFSETRIIKDGEIILDVYSRWGGLDREEAYEESLEIISIVKDLKSVKKMIKALKRDLGLRLNTHPKSSRSELKILDIEDYEKEYNVKFTGYFTDHGIQYDMDTKLYTIIGYGGFQPAEFIIDSFQGSTLPEVISNPPGFKATKDFQMDEESITRLFKSILVDNGLVEYNGMYIRGIDRKLNW